LVCYLCGKEIKKEEKRDFQVEWRMPASPNCAWHIDCEEKLNAIESN